MVRGGAGRRDKADPRDLEGTRGRNRVGGRLGKRSSSKDHQPTAGKKNLVFKIWRPLILKWPDSIMGY